jgi:hypothetical protein
MDDFLRTQEPVGPLLLLETIVEGFLILRPIRWTAVDPP